MSLKAVVAFWTIAADLLDPSLISLLKHEDSFVAVDVHLPTDIDVLASLAAAAANLRIYAEEIPTLSGDGRREPPALLHAKMLLFTLKDGTSSLWVGSHNWTNRALLGLNVEASLVVTLAADSRLLAEASTYLDHARAISSAFDPSQADYYKQLQRMIPVETAPVIELEADDGEAFGDLVIELFGTDASDLEELGEVGRRSSRLALASEL